MLNKSGIGANAFYGQALPHIEGLQGILPRGSEEYSNAVSFADRLITLPSHEDVTCKDITLIASVLATVSH